MSKSQLIRSICSIPSVFGWDRKHLQSKTVKQLEDIHARHTAIASVSAAECNRHCNTSFLPG